jgi:hypothetical protein
MLKKWILFTATLILTGTLTAKDISKELKNDLRKYIDKVPGIGMVTDKVECEGITLSDFSFMGGKKFVFAEPGEEIKCQVRYETHKEAFSNTSIHFFLVGLYPQKEAQTYVTKTLGFMNEAGVSDFTLIAPEEKGTYQVRFCHGAGLTFEQAKESWHYDDHASPETVMGVVIVK